MATPMNQLMSDHQGGFSIVPSGAATPPGGAPAQPAQTQSVPDGRSPTGKRPRSDVAPSSGPAMNPSGTSSAVMVMRLLLQSTAEAL